MIELEDKENEFNFKLSYTNCFLAQEFHSIWLYNK